jgi:hypothetical protein
MSQPAWAWLVLGVVLLAVGLTQWSAYIWPGPPTPICF